ncbi:hypothetical protein [Phenylobacterium sp.]|uniref:hypothetical protein n=1 Tax=Phenylobacterium sp. TaxID=1871053 RepID=UPI00286DF2B4|nr:hypothetical protein [Phenylobacterium sp.]
MDTTPKATAKRSKSILDGLNVVEQPEREKGFDPVRNRRQKLSAALMDQLRLVEATLEGQRYRKVVTRRRRDLETDEMFQVEQEKRVIPWWWIDDNGLVQFALRHGSARLRVKDGKNVLVLSDLSELLRVLPALRQEVMAGRLDEALAEAAGEIYGRFGAGGSDETRKS